ncbi:MAG: tetratricopeptide repeat protein [Lentisphaerae bacterium]|nr:tetratricopeptide repeat protein [Lentisphaerota bacterium]
MASTRGTAAGTAATPTATATDEPTAGATPPPTNAPSRTRLAVAAMVIAAAVAVVYAQVASHAFHQFDDDEYIVANAVVQQGLTAQSLTYAFTTCTSANWHPLTVLSHMLDCELFGLDAGAHLTVNGVLHAANAVLLMLLLARLTGAFWPSLGVALLVAVHPLNVESVAWASQRKAVLSGLFALLTLHAHVAYARRPGPGRLACTGLCLALGLLSKPTLVMLPFALILLDLWPLRRLRLEAWSQTWRRPVLEKIPLVALSLFASLATLYAQTAMGAVASRAAVPFDLRLANAAASCGWYLLKAVFPWHLGVFYPLPAAPPWGAAALAAVALAGLSWAAWRWRFSRPWTMVGLLWYGLMLVPVLGLIQVGGQAHADRYAYLPLIGFWIGLVWLLDDLTRGRPDATRRALATLAAAALAALTVAAHRQVAHWRDGEALFTRALQVCGPSAPMHSNLGNALIAVGRHAEAVPHYRAALAIAPNDGRVLNNLGSSLMTLGRLDEAIPTIERALELNQGAPQTAANLGSAYVRAGRLEDGIRLLEQAAAQTRLLAVSYAELGDAYAQLGRLDQAVGGYERALAADPSMALARYRLGRTHLLRGDRAAARGHFKALIDPAGGGVQSLCMLGLTLAEDGLFQAAVEYLNAALGVRPDFVPALIGLAHLRATCPEDAWRNGAEAVEKAARAVALEDGRNPFALDTLAAAYAEAGRFTEAVATAQRAIGLLERSAVPPEVIADCRQRLALYTAGQPYRSDAGLRPNTPPATAVP